MKPPSDLVVTDSGRRLSDAVNQALVDGHVRKWVAGRLSDGGTDGVVYDRRSDAIRHQLHETQCCYLMVPQNGMSPEDATAYLDLHRLLYDQGARLIDPDNLDRHVVPTLSTEQGGALNRAGRRLLQRRRTR